MPILEVRYRNHRHWPVNEEKAQLLKSHGFRWSSPKDCWWKLAGAEAEELAEELRKKFISVEVIQLPPKGE